MGLPWHRRYRRTLLSQAVWAVQAGQLLPSGRGLVDLSGNGNHAYFGGNSTTPTTNDPTVLPWRGQKEVWFPGTAGNYLSTTKYIPSGGVFRVEVGLAATDYTPSPQKALAAVYDISGQRSWMFFIDNSAAAAVNLSGDGSNFQFVLSSAVVPNGTKYLALEINLSASTIDFETSNDGVAWAALGTQRTFTPLTLFNSSAELIIGAHSAGAGFHFAGRIGSVRLYQDGVQVRGFNAANCAEPYATVADEVSGTWTFNRSSSGLKLAVVDRDMLVLGTDDFLEIPNSALLDTPTGQPWSIAVLARVYGSSIGTFFSRVINTGPGGGKSIALASTSSNRVFLRFNEVNAVTANNDLPDGTLSLICGAFANGRHAVSVVGKAEVFSTTGAGDTSRSTVSHIGHNPGGSVYSDSEIIAAAFFRERLSADDLRRLAQELGVAA